MSETIQPSPFNRDRQIRCLSDADFAWDIIVIGGGATGLGAALDAVSRGYKTLLVEKSDFAKGTSSRSTKLVHGGVRYLAQGNIQLVREASIERATLCKNAPHLAKNQTFLIPVYTYWEMCKYTIGLKLYDWISGRLSMGSSFFIGRKKTFDALPGINSTSLIGSVLYHDGTFDDSRLALNLAQTIVEQGGCVINYMKVSSLLKNTNQKIEGVVIQDIETSQIYRVKAKAVINATGVFVDDILRMNEPGSDKTICVSQGVHIVLDKKFYPSSNALMIPRTDDGRVLFAVPWYNKVLIGTTDTPVSETVIEPTALEHEIDFILKTASRYFTMKPERKDVLSVFAGLRPLAAVKNDERKTKEISRSHKIISSTSGLFTMIGGKWTTYRKMGEDMINHLEKSFTWKPIKTRTPSLQIHGYDTTINWDDPIYFYGSDISFIKNDIDTTDGGWLSDTLKIHRAQVVWAVKQEMARTVEDFLSRRTRALIIDAKESIRICPQVACIMAEALGRDEVWVEKEISAYTTIAKNYILS